MIRPGNRSVAAKVVSFEAELNLASSYVVDLLGYMYLRVSFDKTVSCFEVDACVAKRSAMMYSGVDHLLDVYLCRLDAYITKKEERVITHRNENCGPITLHLLSKAFKSISLVAVTID